jgi:hypothetical protein
MLTPDELEKGEKVSDVIFSFFRFLIFTRART